MQKTFETALKFNSTFKTVIIQTPSGFAPVTDSSATVVKYAVPS